MIFKTKKSFFASLVIYLTVVNGCAKYQPHPGSTDTFDSRTYDLLLVSQASLDKAKQEYAAGTLSGSTAKEAINKAGEVYNLTRDAWNTYHGLKVEGKDATDAVARINALIPQLNQAIQDVKALTGKT